MALCMKAAVNMEDKYPLNLDKFHLCYKVFQSCPQYLTTSQLTWTTLLSIKLAWFHTFTFQLYFLVCLEIKSIVLKYAPKCLSNIMQCLSVNNLKFAYLCKKIAMQTSSVGG